MKTTSTLLALVAAMPAVARADVPIAFVRHDLDSGAFAQVTEGVGAGDVDGRHGPDIVVGGDDYLVVYRSPDFVPDVLVDEGYKFGGGAAVVVHDVDGDGRADVVTGRYRIDEPDVRETVWYENAARGWIPHLLSADAYCHDVAFGDIDGDGRDDLGCADPWRDRIVWLRAPVDRRDPWPVHGIDERAGQGMAIVDVDGDGHRDVVSGRAWYRSSGGTEPDWDRVALTDVADEADHRFDDYSKVTVLDLDDDGRLDVFATLFTDGREGEVWAFFQPPDPTTSPWPALQLDAGPLFGVHSQGVGVFDGTTRPQLFVGETNIGGWDFGPNPSPRLFVYRRIGDARTAEAWERILVDTYGTHEAQVIDLDGDGLSDIAGTEENTDLVSPPRDGVVSWWQNVTTPPGATPTATSTTIPCTDDACARVAACDDPGRCPSDVDCADDGRRMLAAAACVCRDAAGDACVGVSPPSRFARRAMRACAALDRAASAHADATSARRVRGAIRDLVWAEGALSDLSIAAPCKEAVATGLAEALRRAAVASQETSAGSGG